jgi:hypothetical protein
VQFELDSVSDVTTPIFNTYNTGSLPSGGPARDLSVTTAFAEAGVEILTTAGDVIPLGPAGPSWSNAELHASMEAHFSLYVDRPEWRVWECAAQTHDFGTGLYGIMFDQQGRQRQGCAVFHAGIGGNTADKLRLQLYTYVHELGHCFNLLHSWQKALGVPPGVNRPAALSFMNYPWNYPSGGPNAFWNEFAFQFDDGELLHLRHAFLKNVIMGGNNFAVGSGLENLSEFEAPLEDNSRLQLEISSKPRFAFGEPVVVTVKLVSTDPNGRRAHPSNYLHPNLGLVQIGICRPNGEVLTYKPLIEHCAIPEEIRLTATDDAVEASAYCGYGKDGFYFSQTGFYQLRAIYTTPDGSRMLSNILHLRVQHPTNAAEEEIADLFFGRDQGALFYLLGSDSPALQRGNDKLQIAVEKYPDHPLADYVRMLQGVNALREFKIITAEKEIKVRKPKQEEGDRLLSAILSPAKRDPIIDAVTLREQITPVLMEAKEAVGDKAAAAALGKSIKAKAKPVRKVAA